MSLSAVIDSIGGRLATSKGSVGDSAEAPSKVDVVPDLEPFWAGRSLVGALASFLPGDSALSEMTPARWFQESYDRQQIAGFAFSQDAEAYLNFGWLGPAVWFGIGGWLLGVAYRRATYKPARPLDAYVWWYSLAVALMAIRADSRGLFKLVIFGLVGSRILWKAAEFLTKRESRAVRRAGQRKAAELAGG